ncbi:MAG: hypothetical protein ACPGYV_00205 [Phycisphaeraceae bacterium]
MSSTFSQSSPFNASHQPSDARRDASAVLDSMRWSLVLSCRQKLRRGIYDDPAELGRRLDASMDRILADLAK